MRDGKPLIQPNMDYKYSQTTWPEYKSKKHGLKKPAFIYGLNVQPKITALKSSRTI
jgi:hypothetical protein